MIDISTRADIERLVDSFYGRVKLHPLLGPQFMHVNWVTHLPVMYDFWSSMLLGDQTYHGSPFQKHVNLPINREHFAAWLELFNQTIDEAFRGEKADEIKSRAQSIAGIFQHKMGLM